jgi:hypothetical protein
MSSKKLFFPPVPFDWIKKIHDMELLHGIVYNPTTSLVAIAIYRSYLIGGRSDRIKLPHSCYKDFYLSRHVVNRILSNLEKAEVVSLTKMPGRSPIVSLLVIPDMGVKENG